jgi:hypothetical protein
MDADCATKLACFSGECRNPCIETKPCGTNAECIVVDTLPLRTMSCQCLPNFVGDADIQCVKGKRLNSLRKIMTELFNNLSNLLASEFDFRTYILQKFNNHHNTLHPNPLIHSNTFYYGNMSFT